MRPKRTTNSSNKPVSFYLFILPIILTLIGLFFVFEASSVLTLRSMNDPFYYLKQQGMWLIIGIFVMIFFSKFDYHKLYYLAFPTLLITILSLFLVLLPGIGIYVNGARRWINLGFTGFQPTELAKFSIILYLSSWFLYKERERFFSYLFLLSIIVFLIMLQPDMGTTLIITGIFFTIYFLAGIEVTKLLLFLPFAGVGFYFLMHSSPYRLKRFLAFLNPELDPLGIGYHVNQILISLSAGGIFGRGFGGSRQKYQFLPEAHTDSIFAIIGEEVGFVGCIIIILIFSFLIIKIYQVAKNSKDRFGFLLSGGVFGLLIIQFVLNLGSIVALVPLTGVPLPFLSYGGSSLLIFFGLIGIVINIAKQSKV